MDRLRQGQPARLGGVEHDGGAWFAVWSGCAEQVDLCLFDEQGRETRHPLFGPDEGVWHGFLPGGTAGQRYGYRVHGAFDPLRGAWCNPAKLLIDPYARELDGELQWAPAVFGHDPDDPMAPNLLDSAPFVPKSRVTRDDEGHPLQRPRVAPPESIFYELNLRGFTMRHPALGEGERGVLRGLRNRAVVDYLRALGITTVELMPLHAFADEHALAGRGLRNYWGYNSLSFFAPAPRLLGGEPAQSAVRDTVETLHEAGIEVVLDVVYNHTAESDQHGPTLSFRGLDNLAYYRTETGDPSRYVNDSGCGNIVNADHPRVQDLIVHSLRYWFSNIGMDGFRFDLAPILGRSRHGYDPHHPLLQRITSDPVLRQARLIAEPWDIGPGGYQLGRFPSGWAEWNDRFRDDVRRYWRGDEGLAPALARRLHGSGDLFEGQGRPPWSSVNFVTSHDGYTLFDLVSYLERHNEANGEDNRDGHRHNYSQNFGIEGPTDDPEVLSLRRRQRLSLLATLLFAQGTPLLLAGDELGHSQQGNNNAYAQDNEIGWLDWSGLDDDPDFTDQVRALIALRGELPLLRGPAYRHGDAVAWRDSDGRPLDAEHWPTVGALVMHLRDDAGGAVLILVNPEMAARRFRLPEGRWWCRFRSDGDPCDKDLSSLELPARALALLAG